MVDCIFCKIAADEIPATIVARTADAVAFRDLNPQAPTHVLVVPIRHFSNPTETDSEEGEQVLARTMRLAIQTARQLGLEQDGYRLVVNSGENGGQSVFHLHVHLLGGRRMKWPPG